ncbi:TetR/AcrR family transcriptional regulator [Brachybacterium alimentarium]|uniref:TetR family transcriptional regulator n=1 Tax=Brachybacterium alimentarium TaxID=47845 RepID=A0A2A3YEI5_9MICO|nr:helix-turn-helix domain-containing protein [Brachybacterium alimentarium]PCC37651.1 TetR family transcriptional regulator [Brachybacterium alimentarium]RCS74857.1 TetR/AcrR family transcriptional regulator [Brachybacterium alimentarium]
MGYWDHRKPVRRARAVDVEAIARESVELLDAGGLRALTIRAVAARLGVAPASLYSRLESVDDLFDLALDRALSDDEHVQRGMREMGIHDLMLALHHHLLRHPWACQVIGFRAPRGPGYLRLSERMCSLLTDANVPNPLSTSYALSNFVIGSATTAPVSDDERFRPVDPSIAPLYAQLHAEHVVSAHQIVAVGLAALLQSDLTAQPDA